MRTMHGMEVGLKTHVYRAYREKKSFQVEVTRVPNKPYDTLQEMIGLTEVKIVIDEIIAASKVVRARERMGLNTQGASFHMMFSGNPGTAKTSVARLLCKILKEESATSSGAVCGVWKTGSCCQVCWVDSPHGRGQV